MGLADELQATAALLARGDVESALARSQALSRQNPRAPGPLLLQAEALRLANRAGEAVQALEALLAFEPDNRSALQNSATLLHMTGQLDVAATRYERLAELLRTAPAFGAALDYALANAVSCRRAMCAWDGLPRLEAWLVDRVRNAQAAIKPILSLMVVDDPAVQALCARRTWARQFGAAAAPRVPPRAVQGERIRVGYLCGDFREHPTSWLIAGLIERHDRDRFEVVAYASGPDDGSDMRRRLVRAFDRFVDVALLDDAAAAARIARDEIDILVDLNGLTDWGRGGILARRPAPVIVHFLGYPGPMGTKAVDYLVADEIVVPRGREGDYDCAIVRLPGSYQVNDAGRALPDLSHTREEFGLPARGVVFCGFSQPEKLSPAVFDVWMRILSRTPESVLWLLEDNRFTAANLRREAAARGVDPARLVFGPRVPQERHIARHALADIVLDTWPCGGHTSASDALWTGVPVVTRPGRTFASRVAASVLAACGLPELVAEDLPGYEELAVGLALSPERRQELREKIARHKASAPLFDTDRSRANLERAYVKMRDRALGGAEPQSFDVHE